MYQHDGDALSHAELHALNVEANLQEKQVEEWTMAFSWPVKIEHRQSSNQLVLVFCCDSCSKRFKLSEGHELEVC